MSGEVDVGAEGRSCSWIRKEGRDKEEELQIEKRRREKRM